MTGPRVRSARAVPSVLLALFCAVLAVFPATPGRDATVAASEIASLTAHHADVAVVASRGESPVARHHDAPASDLARPTTQSRPAIGPAATGRLRYDASAVAGVALPGVRAPPEATT